jgi:hypothetical protein
MERRVNIGDTVELVWNPYHTRILDNDHDVESLTTFRSTTEQVTAPRDNGEESQRELR